ncbi:phosphate ABC transporter substrate-binding protein PstS [Nesterenkonia populi]
MNVSTFGRAAAILSVASLALVACGDNGDVDETDENGGGVEENGDNGEASGDVDLASVSGNLAGAGASSFQLAIQEWQAEFPNITDGANVDYDPVGSGDGRAQFLNEAVAFAGSDALMDEEEFEESQGRCGDDGAFHIPTAILPIAVGVNLEGVDELNLDGETIAQIFSGEITSWDDDAIAELNEDAELPSETITVVHRQDSSGTTENFTDYLEQATEAWAWDADSEWPGDISAETGDGTSGVIEAALSVDGAITYADAEQAEQGGLTSVSLVIGEDATGPSPEAAAEAVASSELRGEGADNDMGFDLNRATDEEGAYPIVQVAYTIWCNEYSDEEEAELAQAFAAYITSEDAQQIAAEEAGAAPLNDELMEQAQESISQISAG